MSLNIFLVDLVGFLNLTFFVVDDINMKPVAIPIVDQPGINYSGTRASEVEHKVLQTWSGKRI
ncbi:hypothetical protein ANO11243_080940 [Dothideomycetidae sp. 11243]|nr:hypothetical protein ANO11243_080940 [fungal sp. No.11243]